MQRRPGFETKKEPVKEKLEPLKHRPSLEITEKTTKGQIPVIEGWNEMRERLLRTGEMEP